MGISSPCTSSVGGDQTALTPNLLTKIVSFRGFDSSVISNLRGGIPRPIGDFPESLSRAILVGCNVSREIGRKMTTPELMNSFKTNKQLMELVENSLT